MRVAAAFGFGLCLYGVLVLAGWHLEKWILVRSAAGLSPMQYNTALWVTASGAALGFLVVGQSRVAFVLGNFVALFALVTCAEYSAGHSFGIDQFFMQKVVPGTEQYRHPGRPSLMATVLFLLCSGALIALAARRPRLLGLVWALCAVALSLCALALFGVLFGLAGTYA